MINAGRIYPDDWMVTNQKQDLIKSEILKQNT